MRALLHVTALTLIGQIFAAKPSATGKIAQRGAELQPSLDSLIAEYRAKLAVDPSTPPLCELPVED